MIDTSHSLHNTHLDVEVYWASHHKWEPGARLNNSSPPSTALWLIVQGNVFVRIGERSFHLLPGMAFLMPEGITRDISTPHGGEWLSVGLNTWTLDGKLLELLPLPLRWQPAPAEWTTLQTMMAWMVDTEQNDQAAEYIRTGLGRAVVGVCWRIHGSDTCLARQRKTPPWLTQILRRIRENPGMTVTELASEARYSPAQFRRLFARYLDVSPQQYIQQIRLQEAQRLLTASTIPVGEVATQLGFASVSHFTRLFKQKVGLLPTVFRVLRQSDRL